MEGIAGGKVQLTEYADTDNYYLFLSDHIIFQARINNKRNYIIQHV